jgi:hypothetical protein
VDNSGGQFWWTIWLTALVDSFGRQFSPLFWWAVFGGQFWWTVFGGQFGWTVLKDIFGGQF